ncbi:MAG: Ig-like domain-containing protein [Bacteroidota bacterium]
MHLLRPAISILLLFLAMACSEKSFAFSTRYDITVPDPPSGATSFCQGGSPGAYTNLASETSCTNIGFVTNTITWQWVYDGGTYISGATGSFIVEGFGATMVTLTAGQAAVLSTLSPGTHTLQVQYTPDQTNCVTSAGVPVLSPALTFTVIGPPGTITGSSAVCPGSTLALANPDAPGTWSSSNTAIGTVSSAGVVAGLAAGTTTISFTKTCGSAIKVVTVNTSPSITGTAQVCEGSTTALAASPGPGTWSSSNTAAGTVSTSGVVAGVAAGTTIITYTHTATGCRNTRIVTVNALPAAITGTASACQGAATTLSSATGSGTWSTTTGLITSVSSTGVVTGLSAGFGNIVYTLPNGCAVSKQATINPLPVVTLSPSSSAAVCAGSSTSITANAPNPEFSILSQDFNTGLTGWNITSSSGNAASVWQLTSPPGYLAAIAGDGSTFMQAAGDATGGSPLNTTTLLTSPSFSTVGYTSASVKFNQYLASVTGSDNFVDVEYSVAGGPWLPVVGQVGIFSGGGAWSSSSPEVSEQLPPAALGQADVRLRWNYNSDYGLWWAIDNITVNALQPAPAYAWSGVGGATGLSCTSCAAPVITPTTIGTNNYNITVTTASGCITNALAVVTMNPMPDVITGPAAVCVNAITIFTDAVSGGSWASSDPAVAAIDASSGIVTGMSAGTALISYTLSTGCRVTKGITVNALPAAIAGTLQTCTGLTTTLATTATGGLWGSSNTAIANISGTGVMSGIAAGTATISYTLPATGCYVLAEATINPQPAAITGTLQLCEGLSTTLANPEAGGTWVSSNTATASIGAASGVVSALLAGNSTITYTLPGGCYVTRSFTVNQMPAAITGAGQVCAGQTTNFSNPVSGGDWVSEFAGIALIDGSGMISGITAGVSTMTYTLPGGCYVTRQATVNALPGTITGTRVVCAGLTTTLSNSAGGGTWTSTATGIAAIDISSGVVTGLAAGTSAITYQLPTGCLKATIVTVNALPAAITGATQVCEGLTTMMSSATTGGSWSSSTTAVATIVSSGMVTGHTAGTTTITYALPTGCIATTDVLVNPTPDAIGGIMQVCEAATTTLGSTSGGGTWASGASGIASVDVNSGVVSGLNAGVATMTYTLPTTCLTVANVTVNALPAAITGAAQVCVGSTAVKSNTFLGGAWSSGATGVAAISATTGSVTGLAAGMAAITYTLPTGCLATSSILVNPLPGAITGTMPLCIDGAAALSNASPGGTWTSGTPGLASIDPATGLVSAVSAGNAVITYTLPTSCRTTAVMTVNPLPAAITGATQICEGATATLANTSAGGTWSSSTSVVATISAAGIATAVASGSTLITYTLPTGCMRSRTLVINPLPGPVTGATQLCEGSTTVLANAMGGGFWSSSMLPVATISSDGVVSGVTPGTAHITYMLATGCKATTTVTVTTLPSPISGALNVCAGAATELFNATSGGSWISGTPAVATVAAAGTVSGVSAGSTTVTYQLATGCLAVTDVTVYAAPAAITGASQVCQGSAITLANAVPGGVWTTTTSGTVGVGLHTGVVTGTVAGTANITYTLLTGCYATAPVVVNVRPFPIAGTLAVCNGQSSTLTSAPGGGGWTSSNTAVATISATGAVTSTGAGNTSITYALPTGCMRSTTYTVNASPAVYTITGGGDYCEGGAGMRIGIDNSETGVNYALYFGSTHILTLPGAGGSPLDFGPVTGVGSYSIVASNAVTGCATNMAGTATITTTAVVEPTVTVSTGAAGYSVCAGALSTFTGTTTYGGATPTYIWKLNGVPVPGATGTTYSYTPSNGDVVSMMMISTERCAFPTTPEQSHTMTVNTNQTPTATMTATPGTTLCAGTMASFNVASTYGGTAPVYSWIKNGAIAGSGTSFTYMPGNGDNISVVMHSNYSCRLADSAWSAGAAMVVNPLFVPVVTISANPGTAIKTGTSVTLTAAVVDGGAVPQYQWYVGAAPIPGATSATYTSSGFVNGDSISCEVTGTGACGMKTFNSVVMSVTPLGVGTAGQGSDVILAPNPNKGQFTVRGTLAVNADQEVNIEVTNMLGQTVYSSKVMARNGVIYEQLQLGNTLANGMYMLNMTAGGERKVFHFVLEQ